MMAFFEKIERVAERLVNGMDDQLQEPLIKVMMGEVFVSGDTSVSATNTPCIEDKTTPPTPSQGKDMPASQPIHPTTPTPVGIRPMYEPS
jgi:hypothetical protein